MTDNEIRQVYLDGIAAHKAMVSRDDNPHEGIASDIWDAGWMYRQHRQYCREANSEMARVRKESEAEAIRLWRIAICEPESIEAMRMEIASLGNATPEACRAIDAMSRRVDKVESMQTISDLRRMLRTAQDAAVIAIGQHREMEYVIQKWREATGCQTPEDFDAYTAAVRAQIETQDGTRIEVATNSGEAKV